MGFAQKGAGMDALLEYERYMPLGMYLQWETWLVLLWAGSDLLIFAAYMAIPMAIFMVLRRRPDLNHRGLVTLFASFILLCGVTHAMSIVALWYAIYPLMGAVKLATGIVSLATAAMLFRLIPTFIRTPTPDRHEEVIAQLEVTLVDLALARDELESRVNSRTQELEQANSRLSLTARDAVQRSRNLIQTVSALTRPGSELNEHPDKFLRDLRGRINSLAIATSTVMEHNDSAWASMERVVRRQVEPLFADPNAKLSVSGPMIEVGAQGAQQLSLVAWELASRFVKMGRWDQERARIEVKWSVSQNAAPHLHQHPHQEPGELASGDAIGNETDAGAVQFKFEWREILKSHETGVREFSGKGGDCHAVTPEPLTGFRDTLLTGLVPRSLGGKARIDIKESTLIYTLTCPLSAVINAGELDVPCANDTAEGQAKLVS